MKHVSFRDMEMMASPHLPEEVLCGTDYQLSTGENLICKRDANHGGKHHSCCEDCGVGADKRAA
jgi:hypothetical protein